MVTAECKKNLGLYIEDNLKNILTSFFLNCVSAKVN